MKHRKKIASERKTSELCWKSLRCAQKASENNLSLPKNTHTRNSIHLFPYINSLSSCKVFFYVWTVRWWLDISFNIWESNYMFSVFFVVVAAALLVVVVLLQSGLAHARKCIEIRDSHFSICFVWWWKFFSIMKWLFCFKHEQIHSFQSSNCSLLATFSMFTSDNKQRILGRSFSLISENYVCMTKYCAISRHIN